MSSMVRVKGLCVSPVSSDHSHVSGGEEIWFAEEDIILQEALEGKGCAHV